MGTAAALLAALAIREAFAESLPKAVGDELYVPGMLMASFSVPLTSNETFAFDVKARDASPLPLVIMVLDPTDPFTSFMARDNASLDRFITTDESLDNSTFLFLERARGEAAALEARLAARMDALGLPDGARAAWRRRLAFANFTTVDELGGALQAVTAQWLTPVNTLVARDTANETNLVANTTRLDGLYGWCAWPGEEEVEPLVYGGDACGTIDADAVAGRFALFTLDGGCAPDDAARASAEAGVAGALIGAPPGASLTVVGNSALGADDGVDAMTSVVVAMVPAVAAAIAETLAGGGATVTATFSTEARRGAFLAVDTRGALQEVGWEKYATLGMLSWAAQWLAFDGRRAARAASPAIVAPLFERAVLASKATSLAAVPAWELVAASASRVELDLALSCEGSADADCATWDHCVTLTATCRGDDDESRTLGAEPGGDAHELGRWVTPFRRRAGRWTTDVTALASALAAGGCAFELDAGGSPWVATASLRYELGGGAGGASASPLASRSAATAAVPGLPFAMRRLEWPNTATKFNSAAYNENRTLSFSAPAGTARVTLRALASGHGNCEFLPTSHHYALASADGARALAVNSSAVAAAQFMAAGSALGCTEFVPDGALPNEHGTWYYGRNGWCDGMDVKPLEWDVTAGVDLDPSAVNTITYHALSYAVGGGHASDEGCGGYILLSNSLAFYAA